LNYTRAIDRPELWAPAVVGPDSIPGASVVANPPSATRAAHAV